MKDSQGLLMCCLFQRISGTVPVLSLAEMKGISRAISVLLLADIKKSGDHFYVDFCRSVKNLRDTSCAAFA